MVTGKMKANGLILTELSIEYKSVNALDIQATARLVDSVSGQTCATTRATNWPPEVLQKVKELTACMEAAMAKYLFVAEDNGQMPLPLATVPTPVTIPSDGLGDYLRGGEPTSI